MSKPATTEKIGLERLAKAIRRATDNAWGLCLGGGRWPHKDVMFQRMKTPRVGDMVVETTTIGGWRDGSANDIDAVGELVEIAYEPMRQGESGEPSSDNPPLEWDEEADGPRPTERAYYIRTLDGRRFRWVNANFIAVPEWRETEVATHGR